MRAAEPQATSQPVPGLPDPVVLTDAPFTDSSPDDLTFCTDAPRLPALATRRFEPAGHPGTALELRVLGASHQVVLQRGEQVWTETLACRPGREPFLPARHRHGTPVPFARDYEAACTVTGHSPAALRDEVDRMLGACRAAPHAVVVRFAGNPLALTGLSAHEDGDRLRWWTWHVYPQARQIVRSRSALRLLPAGSRARSG